MTQPGHLIRECPKSAGHRGTAPGPYRRGYLDPSHYSSLVPQDLEAEGVTQQHSWGSQTLLPSKVDNTECLEPIVALGCISNRDRAMLRIGGQVHSNIGEA